MKLEENDKPLLFSVTNMPDIFFTEYLSTAKGDYIKVYLYMVFLSKYGKDIKVNDLAKKLELSFSTIQDAIKYWEDIGVITKKNTGYIINDLQEIEVNKMYKPRVALSAEAIADVAQNKARAKAIEYINNKYFQGLMGSTWYGKIDLWFKKYYFDEEVMIALFNYCYDHQALQQNYIQTVADAWFKNNIKTFDDLDKYSAKQEKLHNISKSISKKLNLNRSLTSYEEAYVERWVIDFGYNFDVIEIALKKTTGLSKLSFKYLDQIITDWNSRNLKTADEVNKFLSEYKVQKKNENDLKKKTGYQNHDSRTYTNLDSFYSNL